MRDDAAGPPELTVLILCRNEAGAIGGVVDAAGRFLTRSGVRGEVLVLDNGSYGRLRPAGRAGRRAFGPGSRAPATGGPCAPAWPPAGAAWSSWATATGNTTWTTWNPS